MASQQPKVPNYHFRITVSSPGTGIQTLLFLQQASKPQVFLFDGPHRTLPKYHKKAYILQYYPRNKTSCFQKLLHWILYDTLYFTSNVSLIICTCGCSFSQFQKGRQILSQGFAYCYMNGCFCLYGRRNGQRINILHPSAMEEQCPDIWGLEEESAPAHSQPGKISQPIPHDVFQFLSFFFFFDRYFSFYLL